jgi:transposase
MQVSLHHSSDPAWLEEHIAIERHAGARDRYRVVRLALSGQQTMAIARTVARSRKFVQEWVYRYRDRGREALVPVKRPGRAPKLPVDRHTQFKARLDAGPTADDRVCTLRGRDIRRILEMEFGVVYSGNGVYELLRRLNYSSLKPRPRHRKTSMEQQEQFKIDAPLLPRS